MTTASPGHHSPIPLSRFPLFATYDVDEARDNVACVFCPHRLIPRHKNLALDAIHNRADLDGISLNYIQYGTEVTIEPGTLGSFFLLQVPLSGKAAIRTGGTSFEASSEVATLLSPSLDVRMVWSGDCRKLLVQISREVMEHTLEGFLDRHIAQPIEFDPRALFLIVDS